MKDIYKFSAILLGYGLIIGGFIVFGKSIESDVKVLDIISLCVIYTIFVGFAIFPLIDRRDPAHKEVGMMGVQFYTLQLSCVLSLAVIAIGIIYEIQFKYQLFAQLIALFILLIGFAGARHAGEKVQKVHSKESLLIGRKESMMRVMDDLMDDMSTVTDIEPTVKNKLTSIHESIRFISPSSNPQAEAFDNRFCQTVENLRVLMRNMAINRDKVIEETEHLGRILSRRKNY